MCVPYNRKKRVYVLPILNSVVKRTNIPCPLIHENSEPVKKGGLEKSGRHGRGNERLDRTIARASQLVLTSYYTNSAVSRSLTLYPPSASHEAWQVARATRSTDRSVHGPYIDRAPARRDTIEAKTRLRLNSVESNGTTRVWRWSSTVIARFRRRQPPLILTGRSLYRMHSAASCWTSTSTPCMYACKAHCVGSLGSKVGVNFSRRRNLSEITAAFASTCRLIDRPSMRVLSALEWPLRDNKHHQFGIHPMWPWVVILVLLRLRRSIYVCVFSLSLSRPQ